MDVGLVDDVGGALGAAGAVVLDLKLDDRSNLLEKSLKVFLRQVVVDVVNADLCASRVGRCVRRASSSLRGSPASAFFKSVVDPFGIYISGRFFFERLYPAK